jgi:8-oxo-dGTP diphosphatase
LLFDRGADVYFLPGGVPESSETYAEAAAREVAEEVGVRVDPSTLREVVRVRAEAFGEVGKTVLLVCFEGPGDREPTVLDVQ